MAGTDFSHLTNDELVNGIKALDLPDYIRSKAYGIDVRETLAQITEMTIQLGFNMGLSPEDALLWARKLENNTAQLAQKVGNGKKAELEDLSSTVLSAIEGGEGTSFNLLSIPQDRSVTPEKTTFVEKGKNFIDKDNYAEGYSLNGSTGAVVPLTGGAVTPHFSVPANTQMTQNSSHVICFYDGSGNFISGLPQSTPFIERTFTTPANAATARTAVWQANLMASYQVELGNVSTPYEDYRISLKNFKLPTRSLGQSEMKAPFGYILSGRQIVVDWATKKMSGTITSVYYDDTQILPTNTSFSLDITLNNVSWLYLDLVDGAFKTAIKGQPKGRILVIMEIYATSTAFYYYAPYRPAIRLINYTGQVLQHLNGREIIDRTIEENKLSDSVQFKLNTISENGYNRLFTLNDAYVAWENGEKFPIAFYGDSTTDGVGTTGWVGNVIGQDSTNANAYPKLMEEKLQQATGNNLLRIYNAGFSGKTATWGMTNFNDVFLGTSDYSDAKMIGISWGINDRVLYDTEKAFRAGFKSDIKGLIDKCYANSIQPFLVTTQMVISSGVDTTQSQYLLREATSIETIANEVKRELAVELNLELIDTHDFTERFVKHSQYSAQAIVPDKLHFGNVGHEFEAQLYFAKLYPKTNWINESAQLDYTNQKLVTGVPENRLSMPTTVTDSFKVFANYAKADTVDTLIYKAYVFNDSDSLKTLKAFKSDVTSLTYVKVNGVSTTLDTLEKTISTLDIGLHTLEVYSGTSATVDFKGFKLE